MSYDDDDYSLGYNHREEGADQSFVAWSILILAIAVGVLWGGGL
ncbi:MAG: hypothetical protein OXT67_12825 [Zetaproteobacteria bacterium]|nr:hypothetical protein [Zetaproteobacteria bacterium]